MVHLLEFHGRVSRGDGKPAPTGPADLRFALHPHRESEQILWEETLRAVEITPGGAFHVVLGEGEGIDATLFDGGPRWMSVRPIKGNRLGEDVCERVVVLGSEVRLGRKLEEIDRRLAGVASGEAGPSGRDRKARKRTLVLHRRLRRIEEGGGPVGAVHARIAELEQRLAALDGESGRLVHLEDEIEDVVGPDGDIIDLLERVEHLEGKGPAPERHVPSLTPPPKLTPHMLERLDSLERRLVALESRPPPPLPTAEALHVVKKGGDVMTGGLVINRGGLDVLSGGIKCRGAEVNSLEAALFVKAPKLIGDALEIRGDITVDSTRRTLQIRHIEGRAGSGRKDGGLVLNGRSGALVEVGAEGEDSDGLLVHGGMRAATLGSPATALAVAYQSGGDFKPGEVVGVNDQGHLLHPREAYDPRVVGIVGESPAITFGVGPERKVFVVIGGITRCKVDDSGGPIHAGDLLVASAERGHARRADDPARAFGAVVGKALGALPEGKGEIAVLVSTR